MRFKFIMRACQLHRGCNSRAAAGVVGARNVKWLHKITTSSEESSSPWQQSDYKLYPQTIRTLAAAKGEMALPIQATPVLSAIVAPAANAHVTAGASVPVKGYAWSGGGNSILRVEVNSMSRMSRFAAQY